MRMVDEALLKRWVEILSDEGATYSDGKWNNPITAAELVRREIEEVLLA
jgi:hypothetical protein